MLPTAREPRWRVLVGAVRYSGDRNRSSLFLCEITRAWFGVPHP